MAAESEPLLEAAGQDAKLLQLRAERARVPAALAAEALAEEGRTVAAEIETLSKSEADLALRRDEIDADVERSAERLARLDAQLAAATGGGHELAAMDAERAHLAELHSELETAELEVMEELDPISERLAQLREQMREMGARHATLLAERDAQQAEVDAEGAVALAARDAALALLPDALRSRYEAAAAKAGGPGAAKLSGFTCGGCHLEVPRVEVDRIRHLPEGEFASCEECGRILVPRG